MIAEKEVLTFLLQLLLERGILERLAFQGRHVSPENVSRNPGTILHRSRLHQRRGHDHEEVRRLVVLKLWQAQDSFDSARRMQKFQDGREFD
jgi:hypothetical protein